MVKYDSLRFQRMEGSPENLQMIIQQLNLLTEILLVLEALKDQREMTVLREILVLLGIQDLKVMMA